MTAPRDTRTKLQRRQERLYPLLFGVLGAIAVLLPLFPGMQS